jgi:hypothetical protein
LPSSSRLSIGRFESVRPVPGFTVAPGSTSALGRYIQNFIIATEAAGFPAVVDKGHRWVYVGNNGGIGEYGCMWKTRVGAGRCMYAAVVDEGRCMWAEVVDEGRGRRAHVCQSGGRGNGKGGACG